MRQITINGREYNIGYNMNTALAYEDLSGEPATDFQQFTSGKAKPQLLLGYAMLLTNNPIDSVPKFDELMESITSVKEQNAFIDAVAHEMLAYYQPSKNPNEEPEQEGDPQGNA